MQFITNSALVIFHYASVITISYIITFLVSVLVRIAIKLRSQVYNSDLKLKASRKKAILITGATSGLGLALSKYFHRKNFTIIVGYYSQDESGYGELIELSSKEANSMLFVKLDVRSKESISESYSKVKTFLSDNKMHLHALVNNAGITPKLPLYLDGMDKTKSVIETNLLGPMLMIRQYLPLLAEAPSGRIVNVSSVLAFIPFTTVHAYGATKLGLAYLNSTLDMDLQKYKVRSLVLYPGNAIMNTSIMSNTSDDVAIASGQLSEIDKRMFSKEFEIFSERAIKTGRFISRTQERTRNAKSGRRPEGLGSRIFQWMSGAIELGVDLDKSSFMASYDNALCLENPPAEMFAGNRFFSVVIGSILESLSHKSRLNIGCVLNKIVSLLYGWRS